jgi:hypothetical protein
MDCVADDLTRSGRGEAAFEFVEGDDDLHTRKYRPRPATKHA